MLLARCLDMRPDALHRLEYRAGLSGRQLMKAGPGINLGMVMRDHAAGQSTVTFLGQSFGIES